MLIIKIEPQESGQHLFQSQSHRTECWEEGYVAVPPEREADVVACMGHGDLTVEDGAFVDFTPRPELIPVVEPEPTAEEQLRADIDYIAIMTGVTL